MQEEKLEVVRANESFYRAFESLDIKEMEKVWAKDCEIQCGHPGWRILRGWESVMESWRRIFEITPSMRFMLTDVSVDVCGSVAWVTLYENLTSSLEGQNISVTILATNVFLKASGAWRMIHHHGSSVAPVGAQSDPSTVH